MSASAQTIPGSLLSCYTTSVAGYRAALGLDPLVPLACQWFLELHDGEDPGSPELRHYHSPLLGEGPGHRIELRPERAATAEEAYERIAAEVARHGAAIVMADTERLPWLVTYGKSSAPHWIVLDRLGERGALHVVDRFEWIDEAGEQTAHEGWLDRSDIAQLGCAPALERAPRFRARERWAFGEPRAPPPPPSGDAVTWRWFARAGGEAVDADGLADRLLARSCGSPPPSRGSVAGAGALRRLAGVLDATLDTPEAFGLSNDLWVIGRTRELFLDQIAARPPSWADPAAVRSLTAGAGAEIVAGWQAVSRAMYYDSVIVAAGRPPRRGVVAALRDVAPREEAFLAALAALGAPSWAEVAP